MKTTIPTLLGPNQLGREGKKTDTKSKTTKDSGSLLGQSSGQVSTSTLRP